MLRYRKDYGGKQLMARSRPSICSSPSSVLRQSTAIVQAKVWPGAVSTRVVADRPLDVSSIVSIVSIVTGAVRMVYGVRVKSPLAVISV